jgi:hypothetical protein
VLERELVQREVAGGYYGSGSYLAASLVLDGLLLRAAPALIFAAIMYPMVRAWGGGGVNQWGGVWRPLGPLRAWTADSVAGAQETETKPHPPDISPPCLTLPPSPPLLSKVCLPPEASCVAAFMFVLATYTCTVNPP